MITSLTYSVTGIQPACNFVLEQIFREVKDVTIARYYNQQNSLSYIILPVKREGCKEIVLWFTENVPSIRTYPSLSLRKFIDKYRCIATSDPVFAAFKMADAKKSRSAIRIKSSERERKKSASKRDSATTRNKNQSVSILVPFVSRFALLFCVVCHRYFSLCLLH